ncbi:MAG: PQQ-dependent sugar dehydrogenase, partial [Gemmataceae bacterium]|nr:PQQ-dependent sugar dehydrogenase [Gemmataceae bacterium]
MLLDPNLGVRPVISGLSQPTGLAFLGDNDFLVLEKGTGRVQRVVNGVLAGTALDLAVNAGSERGLLGIALSPNFANDHNVYLYWTESTAVDANGNRTDTANLAETPLLGNRVDRFVWNGSTLTFDRNIIRLRALQPANPPLETQQRGNHDGGKIQFGPDSKLYIVIGDTGRRSWMQNLLSGPLGPGQADDQFGGPTPDDAHLTGVVLRLNPDGSTPTDNPFRSIRNTLVTTLTGANERPN